jgi:cell division septum initiation protein DivIVA
MRVAPDPVAREPGLTVAKREGSDELWSRLRETNERARALAATNRQLAARVTSLERQLVEAGSLSDDELVAELPRRMTRALESAKDVAEELVSRAKNRDLVIRDETDRHCAALLSQAESEATAILNKAARDAVRRVNEAQARANAILASAYARRDQITAELQAQSEALEERVRELRRNHETFVRAYRLVDRTLNEARGALGVAMATAATPLRAHERDDGADDDPPPSRQLRAVTADSSLYDWSPIETGTA